MLIIIQELVGVFILFLFCWLFIKYEHWKNNTYLTPFVVMAVPYALIVFVVNVFGIHFGYFAVSLKSIILVIACLTFFMAGGYLTEKSLKKPEKDRKLISYHYSDLESLFNRYKKFFIGIAIISIIASVFHLRNSLVEVGGWVYIASKDFENAYGKGPLSHVMQMNRPAFIFLCGYYFYSKKKTIFLLLILMYASILILQIKTHMITTLLAGFIFSYLTHVIKINYKKLILYCAVIFLLFNVSYYVGYSRIGITNMSSSKIQIYLLNHFFTYLFGGVIGFSEVLNNPTYPVYSLKEIFAIPLNFYNILYLRKELVDVVVPYWIPISRNFRFFHASNVFTLFGMLYMYLGTFGMLLYMFFVGIVSYVLKFLALKKNAYVGFQLTYAFLLSYLAIAFFDIFFNQLQIYHTSFLMIVLPFCFECIIRIRENARRYSSSPEHTSKL